MIKKFTSLFLLVIIELNYIRSNIYFTPVINCNNYNKSINDFDFIFDLIENDYTISFIDCVFIFKEWYQSLNLKMKTKVRTLILKEKLEIMYQNQPDTLDPIQEMEQFFMNNFLLDELGITFNKFQLNKRNDIGFMNYDQFGNFYSGHQNLLAVNNCLVLLQLNEQFLNYGVKYLVQNLSNESFTNININEYLKLFPINKNTSINHLYPVQNQDFIINRPYLFSLLKELFVLLNHYSNLFINFIPQFNITLSRDIKQTRENYLKCSEMLRFIRDSYFEIEKCERLIQEDIINLQLEIKNVFLNFIIESEFKLYNGNKDNDTGKVCTHIYTNFNCLNQLNANDESVLILIVNPNLEERYLLNLDIQGNSNVKLLNIQSLEIASDIICDATNKCRIYFVQNFDPNVKLIPIIMKRTDKQMKLESSNLKSSIMLNNSTSIMFDALNNVSYYNFTSTIGKEKTNINFEISNLVEVYQGKVINQARYQGEGISTTLNFCIACSDESYVEIENLIFRKASDKIDKNFTISFDNSAPEFINNTKLTIDCDNTVLKLINFLSNQGNIIADRKIISVNKNQNKTIINLTPNTYNEFTEISSLDREIIYKTWLSLKGDGSIFKLKNDYTPLIMSIHLHSILPDETKSNPYELGKQLSNLQIHPGQIIKFDSKCLSVNYIFITEKKFIIQVTNHLNFFQEKVFKIPIELSKCWLRFEKCSEINYIYREVSYSQYRDNQNIYPLFKFELNYLLRKYRKSHSSYKIDNIFIIQKGISKFFSIEISKLKKNIL